MLTIRNAQATDAIKISELIAQLQHLFFLHPNGNGAERFLQMSTPAGLSAFMSQDNVCYLTGELENELCGVVAIRNNTHLQHLFILPKFQRMGIGKQLWKRARDIALESGNSGTFTVNSSMNAIGFYACLGFKTVGDVSTEGGLRFQAMQLHV